MTYKDIIVYLDETKAAEQRLQTALDLAQRYGAHLAGMAIAQTLELPSYMLAGELAQIDHQRRVAASARNQDIRERFEAKLRTSGVSSEWRAVDETAAGQTIVDVLADYSAYTDLVVVGQPAPDDSRYPLTSDFPGQLALMASRPVLTLPSAWRPTPIGKRVLVAWNGGREASRAVHDALPLLEEADLVRVLTLTGKGAAAPYGRQPGVDLATHLARHSVNAESATSVLDGINTSDALLAAASDFGADLLVMGAYGRSRMRELILGGATRDVLSEMTVPVLISH